MMMMIVYSPPKKPPRDNNNSLMCVIIIMLLLSTKAVWGRRGVIRFELELFLTFLLYIVGASLLTVPYMQLYDFIRKKIEFVNTIKRQVV